MNFEPIINARFKLFKDVYGLEKEKESSAFEKFVNHAILVSHQPDAFSAGNEMMDFVSVGGSNDLGIDGIAIKINGLFVSSIQDVTDIISLTKRSNIEFIFIQSKYKPKFDMGELNNFITGVRDFLSEKHLQPRNSKVDNALKIKEHLIDDKIVLTWEQNPSVRLYYVAMGKWRDSPHHIGVAEQFKRDVSEMNAYGDCQVHFIDGDTLKSICDSNENTFTASINSIDTMPLTPVDGVENSCIALCYGEELLPLLAAEDDVIRKSIFNDNVRDYQGGSSVNSEILKTIESAPEKFILLNNGVTIVCNEFIQNNRRITLKNPQVVNGCQTCHVLFNAHKRNILIEKIPINVKIIATKDNEITNQIVRGTNRQNIVYDEAFETTRDFHKNLEDFFNAFSVGNERIFYERRSKQYQDNPKIKQHQKINLKVLTQYFVGMFLSNPHMSHRHESVLLKEYVNQIYQDHQSKLPYYLSSLSFYKLEQLFRDDLIKKQDIYTFRAHILMVFRELVSGKQPTINDEKSIDKYCDKIINCLSDSAIFRKKIEESIKIFLSTREKWVKEFNRSSDGIKDIGEFTKLLLVETNKASEINYDTSIEISPCKYTGTIVKVIKDRNGKYCGFIARVPDDIFFHSKYNPQLNFKDLEGKSVCYNIIPNPLVSGNIATDIRLLPEE